MVLTRLARKLSQLGEPVSAKELIKKVNAGDDRPLEPVVLAENIKPDLYRYMAERRRDYPGIQLEQTYLRTYPQGELAAHVLGSTGRIGPSQIAAYRKAGYEGNETIGVSGVEQTYEKYPGRHARRDRGGGQRRRRAPGPRATCRPRARCRAATSCCRSTGPPRRRSRGPSPTPRRSPAPRARPAWRSTRAPARCWRWPRTRPTPPTSSSRAARSASRASPPTTPGRCSTARSPASTRRAPRSSRSRRPPP